MMLAYRCETSIISTLIQQNVVESQSPFGEMFYKGVMVQQLLIL